MGLLDGLLKSALGGGGGNAAGGLNSGQFQAIWEWIQEQGGIEVLFNKFQQGGLGAILNSWIGNGQNAAIGSGEIQSAFGGGEIQSLADKLGTDRQGATDLLSQFLPNFVDGISPGGEVKPEVKSGSADLGNFVNDIFKR